MHKSAHTRREVFRVLAAGVAALALPIGFARAEDAAPAAGADGALDALLLRTKIGIRRLADDLVVLMYAGGNIAVLDGPDGAVVIDAGLPDRAADVAAVVRAVAKNPPGHLINTHHHFDHVGGNAALAAAGFRVMATAAARRHVSERSTVEFLGVTSDPLPERARPAVTFAGPVTLHANGQALALTPVAPAHTDGDAAVYLDKADVLHAGDLFFCGMYPFFDYSSGGSLDGMIAASRTLLTIAGEKTRIIPGHGPVGARAELQAQLDMLSRVRDVIVPLTKSKTEDEAVAAKPLAVLGGAFSKGFLDDDKFARLVYRSYTRKG